MTRTTLVTGASSDAREARIAAALVRGMPTALILEGLSSGSTALDEAAATPHVTVARIAPGCPCCTGNLTMRVTLNRVLRNAPAHLYIGLASAAHLAEVRAFLSRPPYDKLLTLTEDMRA